MVATHFLNTSDISPTLYTLFKQKKPGPKGPTHKVGKTGFQRIESPGGMECLPLSAQPHEAIRTITNIGFKKKHLHDGDVGYATFARRLA
ncbi:hypothetical protein [Acidovorax sp. CCYZU-2555]|uniref:hypothetical protein n=1 Tax=Acidovorax sp. CCYZU-2555 TaxID=2835042 RepID=UPI001BD1AAB4|nr:hypothetical protein [Acidovorax sp. CCYZU-2555]MBS7776479.1 hypothetical protein [Acidovorax sp. CCYZU-2555]